MIENVTILRPTTGNYALFLATFPVCEGSVRHYELQRDDYIELAYSSPIHYSLNVGDLCYLGDYGTFCVTEKLYPTYNDNTGGYDYKLHLEADYRLWKNHIFKLTYKGERTESEWMLTDTLSGHVRELLRNVVALGFKHILGVSSGTSVIRTLTTSAWNAGANGDFVIGEDVSSGAKLIEYKDTNLIAALDKMASTFECEWWYDEGDKKLHFGTAIEPSSTTPMKLVHETAVGSTSLLEPNMESMTRTASQGNFANRLQVLGGTQNMPENYRKKFILYPTSIVPGVINGNDVWAMDDSLRPLYGEYFKEYGSQTEIKPFPNIPLAFLNDETGTATTTARFHSFGDNYSAVFYADYGDSSGPEMTIRRDSVLQVTNIICKLARTSENKISGDIRVTSWWDDNQEPILQGRGEPIYFNEEKSASLDLNLPTGTGGNAGHVLHLRFEVYLFGRDYDNDASVTLQGTTTLFIKKDESVSQAQTLTLAVKNDNVRTIKNNVPFWVLSRYDAYGVKSCKVCVDANSNIPDTENPYVEFPASSLNAPKVPISYYTGEESDAACGIAERRLQLPVGSGIVRASDNTEYYHNGGYIQAQEVIPEREVIESTEVLEDVFPRQNNYQAGSVAKRYETFIDTFSDGSQLSRQVPIYRFKNASGVNFDDDWVAEGQKLQVVFQSGLLAGMTFDIKFNPDGLQKMILDNGKYVYNPNAQEYEIVVNETYGRELPDEYLYPADGDGFILTGFSPKAMGAMGLVTDAETELLTKGADALQKRLLDGSTYQATLMIDAVVQRARFLTSDSDVFVTADDEVFYTADISSDNTLPPIGRRVSLYHAGFGLNGTQNRVIGFEFPLDMAYDHPKLIIGQTPQKKRLKTIENAIMNIM